MLRARSRYLHRAEAVASALWSRRDTADYQEDTGPIARIMRSGFSGNEIRRGSLSHFWEVNLRLREQTVLTTCSPLAGQMRRLFQQKQRTVIRQVRKLMGPGGQWSDYDPPGRVSVGLPAREHGARDTLSRSETKR